MKRIILLLLVLFTLNVAGQNWSINVYQDVKLALFEDEYGNSPFTLDILGKAELRGKQHENGYIVVYPQMEHAKLSGGKYIRASGGAGYTFNKLSEQIDLSPSINWGKIYRNGSFYNSFEVQVETSLKITRHLRFALLFTQTQRTDLGDDIWRLNGYAGLKYVIK